MKTVVRCLHTSVAIDSEIDDASRHLPSILGCYESSADTPVLRYRLCQGRDGFELRRDNRVINTTTEAVDLVACLESDLLRQVPKLTFGRWVLHASAVSLAGRVAVFVGPSGAGKTTAARILVEAGWHYLSEEVVAIDGYGQVVGLLRPLRTKEPAADGRGLPICNARGDVVWERVWYPPSDRVDGAGELGAIYYIEYRPDSRFEVVALGASDALTHGWPHTLDARAPCLQAAASVVATWPAYRLLVSGPEDVLRGVCDMIS